MTTPIERILLIDDDATNNFIHKLILEKNAFGEEVVAVESVQDAFQTLKQYAPDLILLDLNMPALNGWDFLDQFERELKGKLDCIIVILTAAMDPRDREKAKTYDLVSGYLSKPFKVEHLREVLHLSQP